MVEKVDKPDPSSIYHVQATTETKRDRQREENKKGDSEDEYSGSHAAPGWQKVYAGASNRRYIKIRRDDIARAWFRQTLMMRGVSLAEIDIELKNGKILNNAHIVLAARENFWTLRKFQPGQDIPLNLIISEPMVEVSVPGPKQHLSVPSMDVNGEKESKPVGKKKDIKSIILYTTLGAIVLFMLLYLLFE